MGVVGLGLAAVILLAGAGSARALVRSSPDMSGTIEGMAKVEDGDSLKVGTVEIRLHGIDAPERRQTCWDGDTEIACGRHSRLQLERAVRDKRISCESRRTNRSSGVITAVCYADGIDLNNMMVRSGWAVAFRNHGAVYRKSEEAARAEARGLWQWHFTRPREWRQLMRQPLGDPDAVSGGEHPKSP